jgi:hypothetical protein
LGTVALIGGNADVIFNDVVAALAQCNWLHQE